MNKFSKRILFTIGLVLCAILLSPYAGLNLFPKTNDKVKNTLPKTGRVETPSFHSDKNTGDREKDLPQKDDSSEGGRLAEIEELLQ